MLRFASGMRPMSPGVGVIAARAADGGRPEAGVSARRSISRSATRAIAPANIVGSFAPSARRCPLKSKPARFDRKSQIRDVAGLNQPTSCPPSERSRFE